MISPHTLKDEIISGFNVVLFNLDKQRRMVRANSREMGNSNHRKLRVELTELKYLLKIT